MSACNLGVFVSRVALSLCRTGIQAETDDHSLKTQLHCRRGSRAVAGILQGAEYSAEQVTKYNLKTTQSKSIQGKPRNFLFLLD